MEVEREVTLRGLRRLRGLAARALKGLEEERPVEEPFWPAGWTKADAGRFNRQAKAYLFKALMSYYGASQAEGDYLEFGCCGAFTMRMAWDYTRVLAPGMRYVGFDSFEGFPEVEGMDKEGPWRPGGLSMTEEVYRRRVVAHGMPAERLVTVPGRFEETLTEEGRDRLGLKAARIVYVDCDLYASTVPVLEFVRPLLGRGSAIIFDDWNAFYADEERGERRAFAEFRARYPSLRFTQRVEAHNAVCFVCLGSREEASGAGSA